MGKKKENSANAQEKAKVKTAKTGNEQKNYCLPLESSSQMNVIEDNHFISVQLRSDLEAAMLDLIQQEGLLLDSVGRVSQRLTAKKLTEMYVSLRAIKFQPHHIEQAMSAIVLKGGDIVHTLDWLCLNLPDDQLPEGFSRALQVEEEKCRRRNDRAFFSESSSSVVDDRRCGKQKVDCTENVLNKDWILKYAEGDGDGEEGDSKDASDNGNKVDSSLSDPNERYLELTAKLLDLRSEAVVLKRTCDDPLKLKKVSRSIGDLVCEMKRLERHTEFDPRIRFDEISPLAADNKSENLEDIGLDEACLNMFDESTVVVVKEPTRIVSSVSKADRRSFTYTRQQWTGKSPKQFLNDWTRKNLPNSTLGFEKIDAGGGLWRSKCKITRKTKEGDLIVCPDIVCDNIKDAEHLASVLALYHLCPGQRIDMLLPPPYRDVWSEWRTSDDAAKKKIAADDVKPRDQFIAQLMSSLKLKQQCTAKVVGTNDEEVCESWEDIESEEEGNDVVGEQKPAVATSYNVKLGQAESIKLKKIFDRNRQSQSFKSLLAERQRLPVFGYRNELIDVYRQENVFIVAGETGSGKSTQVPQFILEEVINSSANLGQQTRQILCTEPRRISTLSLAERVSSELGEPSGPGRRDSLCGYRIRFESQCAPTTRLIYCTTGVVLRRLQSDPSLKDIACVIVDEVHERSVESDFLLIHLKHLLQSRPDLRVVLMSATLDANKISSYFNRCPIVNVPGKLFPVELFHLEDVIAMTNYSLDQDSPYSLRLDHLVQIERSQVQVSGERGNVARHNITWTKDDISTIDQSDLDPEKYTLKIRNIVTRLNPKRVNIDLIFDMLRVIVTSEIFSPIEGAVLIFLPGFADIQALYDLLESDRHFGDPRRYSILVLHSALSAVEQSKVFIVPAGGIRKIVLSTNIAETGVTIPDVVFVIDCGQVKENQYSEATRMSQLMQAPISKASANQRRGRAGRVRNGYCFRMYTSVSFGRLASYSVPEILRVPLEELCLHTMKCGFGSPSAFLNEALDPPAKLAVSRAMSVLEEVGACIWDDKGPSLTPLGHHLASLPIDVRLGKMLIYAAILGCLQPAAIMAASMMDKSPFATSFDKRGLSDAAKSRLAIENSDHITVYKAFVGWQTARKAGRSTEREYCEKNCLKLSSLMEIDIFSGLVQKQREGMSILLHEYWNNQNVSRDLVRMLKASGFNASLEEMLVTWKSPTLSSAFHCHSSSFVSPVEEKSISPGLAAILKATLSAGLYPQMARVSYHPPVDAVSNPTRQVCTAQTSQGEAQIHPSSVNRFLATNGWVVYHEKMRSAQCVYLRDVSVVSSCPMLLFGGSIDIQHQRHLVTMDGWISFKAPAKTGVIFKHIRYLIDRLLQQKIENPSLDLAGQPLTRLLMEVLVSEIEVER